MKRSQLIITILLFVLGVLCFVFFDALKKPIINSDADMDVLLRGILARLGVILLFGWLIYVSGGRKMLLFDKQFFRLFIWSLPCFMVAFSNFPYSALINGTASIVRTDLIWLYTLYAISIALLEEFVFRGIFLLLAKDYLRNKRHAPLLITIICSALFSLFHLTNLFGGNADVGRVLLQCVYTFLIGAMLTVTMLKLNNIWLVVVVHAIFNFGGQIIENIGMGSPWDTVFWILTISGGVLCAGHIIYTLIKLDRNYVSKQSI